MWARDAGWVFKRRLTHCRDLPHASAASCWVPTPARTRPAIIIWGVTSNADSGSSSGSNTSDGNSDITVSLSVVERHIVKSGRSTGPRAGPFGTVPRVHGRACPEVGRAPTPTSALTRSRSAGARAAAKHCPPTGAGHAVAHGRSTPGRNRVRTAEARRTPNPATESGGGTTCRVGTTCARTRHTAPGACSSAQLQ